MKIFITGGTGFIGSRLVKFLAERGDQITCLTRDLKNVSLPAYNNVQFIEGDILNKESYRKFLKGVDVLYHLAAFVDHHSYKKKEAYEINVLGARNIFNLAKLNKVPKVLYLSSAAIFHPMTNNIPNERSPFPKKFVNYYSYTKYLGYVQAQKFVKQGLNIVSILPTSVYGPGSPLFLSFFNFLLKRKFFFQFLLNRRLSMVYVDDVVRVLVEVEKKSKFGDLYLVGGDIISMAELIKMVEDFFNIKIKIYNTPKFLVNVSLSISDFISKILRSNFYPNREVLNFLDGNFLASSDKVKKELSWKPVNFKPTFLEMIKWYNKYYYEDYRTEK